MSVMGIDGSFDITVSEGDIKLQLNKLYSSSSKQLSTAVAQVGNVAVTVDPEVILQFTSFAVLRILMLASCSNPFETLQLCHIVSPMYFFKKLISYLLSHCAIHYAIYWLHTIC